MIVLILVGCSYDKSSTDENSNKKLKITLALDKGGVRYEKTKLIPQDVIDFVESKINR